MSGNLQRVAATLFSGLVAVIVALGSTQARAGLISTINLDTPLELDVSWTWNPETDDSSAPVLANWRVDFDISRPVGGNLWTVILNALHTVNPHPPVDVVADIANYLFMFDNATDFGLIRDQTLIERHRIGPHLDEYHLTFDRRANQADTTIHLTGAHVPEPAPLLLLAAGAAGLALRRLRERSPAKNPALLNLSL